ncbi:MAG: transglycosylase SLT domain-containing protein [Proteobacteria bacterium]|nr:transglycosylase SLT domain-containing protein [Cystobacterineae bacterium]MCL2259120.1 transglycosylase SLT domain-containing protein [Cystobacterineae bacterium]MCL2314496.1 transglycosylase SLT domain-containing protein [Pseudomonadota bacterium]
MGRELRIAFLWAGGLLGIFWGLTNCSTFTHKPPEKPNEISLLPPKLEALDIAPEPEPEPEKHGCRQACWSEADFILYPFAERLIVAKGVQEGPRGWELEGGPVLALGAGSKDALAFRYLQGLQALARGENAKAWVLFSELAVSYTEMAAHARYRGGLAAARMKDWGKVVEALSQVEESFRLYADVQFLLAKAYAQQGLWKEARQILEPLTQKPVGLYGRDLGAEALWQLHQQAEAANDKALSQQALLKLWSEHPLHVLAVKAGAGLNTKPLPLEVRVARAEALLKFHRNEEAFQLIEKLEADLKLPSPLACQAAYAKGRALRKMRKHKAAIEVFAALLKSCENSELQHQGSFNLIYSQSIVDTENVFASMERFIQRFGTSHLADDVLLSQARLWMQQGDIEKAMHTLDDIIKSHSNGDMAMDALFLRFWYLRKQGNFAAAWERVLELEKGARERGSAEDLWRAMFWRGQLAIEMGKGELSKAAWEQLLEEGPLSFYAERVRQRQGEWGQRFPKELSSAEYVFSQSSLQKFSAWASALEFWKMGLWSEVAPELFSIPRAEVEEEGLLLMVELLLQSKAEELAFSILRPMWAQGFHPHSRLSRRYWALAYPLAFREEVEQATKDARLPNPNLIQAVMREESACNPQALSWAGARGLLQLMPRTAQEVARKQGIKKLPAYKLMQPELNLKLGAAYLAELLENFDQEPAYAIAAYNAGPNAVSRWQSRYKASILEEWIEDIPIDETRNYIKRVLSSFATYQWLYPSFRALDTNVSAELFDSFPSAPSFFAHRQTF